MNFLSKVKSNYVAYKRIIKSRRSYLETTGWMRSLREGKPVNLKGEPLPWMSYPMIKLLEDKLVGDINVFEYGSGYSTLFFSKRVNSIDSVEYDLNWFNHIKLALPKNASINFVLNDTDGFYCRSILNKSINYDLVVIDGRDRVNCFKQALSAITERGVLLLDDSDRVEYSQCFDIAKNNNFKFLRYQGLKPTGNKTYETTVFYKVDNCFSI